MIDCNIASNYLEEKSRMTEKCKINCRTCPLHVLNNDLSMGCSKLERTHPLEAIAIVQKWSDEHPIKTNLDDFKKKYPKARLDNYGIPHSSPCELGYCDFFECGDCPDCNTIWKQPFNGA